jgi:uncharacterized protein
MTGFSLRRVKLRPGEQLREQVDLELPVLAYGGERYLPVPAEVPAVLEVTRANTGTVFRLTFTARLHGPCVRCLGDAVLEVPIDVREYHAATPEDEQLTTPYLVGDGIDLSQWGRDAVALALPDKILCRADCAGLCGVCGRNLNDAPHTHETDERDPRWAALEALREQS